MTEHTVNKTIDNIRISMSDDERNLIKTMETVRNDYIETSWDDELARRFNKLLRTVVTSRLSPDGSPSNERRETRALIYTGEAGSGKTESLNRLFRSHPALPGYNQLGSGCPLISVTVPAPCTPKALGLNILHKAGRPLVRMLPDHAIWTQVHHQLELAGIVLLHLDEMHNLTDGANVLQIDTIRKTLKALMVSSTWPVGLVISGLPSLVAEMRQVDEIRRRGQFVRIPPLEMPSDLGLVEAAIERCTRLAQLQRSSTIEHIAARLAQASLYRFGILIEIIHEAIESALADGAVELGNEHFANAYADRTGCGDRLNPFIAPDWVQLDCSLVLLDEIPTQLVLPSRARPRARSRRSTGAN